MSHWRVLYGVTHCLVQSSSTDWVQALTKGGRGDGSELPSSLIRQNSSSSSGSMRVATSEAMEQ